jgi:putative transcriptional regulator
MESLKGQLLVAGAGLLDSNFRRTVVLVGEHTEDGALGVVLNRAAPVTVGEVVPALAELAGAGEPMYFGGPVQPGAVVVLADLQEPERAGLAVFGTIGFLTGEVEPDGLGAVRRARVFAGYAGWGPGQLEAEVDEQAWILEPAAPEDVFTEDPDGLWGTVLRRKGDEYRMLALMPTDPSMN